MLAGGRLYERQGRLITCRSDTLRHVGECGLDMEMPRKRVGGTGAAAISRTQRIRWLSFAWIFGFSDQTNIPLLLEAEGRRPPKQLSEERDRSLQS